MMTYLNKAHRAVALLAEAQVAETGLGGEELAEVALEQAMRRAAR